jgi:phage gpG-like protein
MIEFRMSVVNAEKIHFAFGGLADAVKDWRGHIWPAVRNRALRPWLKRQFEKEGQGEHGKWAPLTERYTARKQKMWPGKPILEASGKMKEDLLSPRNEGQMTEKTLEYGTNVPYAFFHQRGTKRMVARRIFDPEVSDERGSLKQLIRSSVAFGVSNHARALGFAVMGDEVTASEAADIGRGLLRGGGIRGFIAGRVPVSEGI